MASGPLLGLDIGSQQIKVVELRPGKNGLTVSALGLGPTPLGVLQNNIITDPALMGQAVRQVLRESGISVKRVVGCISGQNAVVIRIIEVPRMTDAELKETMKWEVERHVPFAPSETVLDYQPLPVREDVDPAVNPNMEVLLAVAQQDAVANYIQTLFAAGLDPVAIDIEPLASARALLDLENGRPLVRPPGPPMPDPESGVLPETVAIVNIGAANTDISIYQEGQLTFPRSLPLAGDSLTRAIAETMGMTVEQAEQTKREHASVNLESISVYTGTAYADNNQYGTPDFQDEETNFLSTGDDALPGNPFDLPADSPFRTTPSGRVAGDPQFDDLERTQPMNRRTLNLAQRPAQSDNAFDLPSDGSEIGLDLPGVAGVDEGEVFAAIAPVLSELASELRRSLDYYRSRGQGFSVDRVLLSGGSANLGNLAAFLQNELQVPVTVADPFAGLTVTSKHYDAAYLPAISPAFAVALGLAARDVVFDANPAPKAVKAPKAPKPPKQPKAGKGQTPAGVS